MTKLQRALNRPARAERNPLFRQPLSPKQTAIPKAPSQTKAARHRQATISLLNNRRQAATVPRHNHTTQIRQALPINPIRAVRVLHLHKHQTKNLPSATPTGARRGTMRFTKRLTIPLKSRKSRSSIRKHIPMTNRFTVGAPSVMCAAQILQNIAKVT